jgi:hypothetical protein
MQQGLAWPQLSSARQTGEIARLFRKTALQLLWNFRITPWNGDAPFE